MGRSRSILTLRQSGHFPTARARVAVLRMPHQHPMEQHLHEFMEIALVLSGSGEHVTEGFRHDLQAGDVLVINRRRAHGYENTQDLNLVNILFRGDLLPRVARDLGVLPGFQALFDTGQGRRRRGHEYISRVRLTPAELAQLEDWAARLEAELSQDAPRGGYLLAEAYLTLIIGVLSRRHGYATWGRRGAPMPGAQPLGKVLSWLEKNLDQAIRVEDMARVAGMSARSLHRAFRANLGGTPLDYLLRRRLQRAAERLRQSPGSSAPPPRISEIAAACGFEDSNYFTRAFRRQFGQSPREYRAG